MLECKAEEIALWSYKDLGQGKKLIYFYEVGPVAFLGNFYPSKIVVDNQTFACAEAAFQYRKYRLLADYHGITHSSNPLCVSYMKKLNEFLNSKCTGKMAFDIHRELGGKVVKNKVIARGLVHQIAMLTNQTTLFPNAWTKGVRDQEMWKILNVKFAPGTSFRYLLNATYPAYLLEHNRTNRDNYWSDNSDGSGENMLGRMLSAIRDGNPMPTGLKESDFMDYVDLAIANPHGYKIFKDESQ